MLWAKLLILLSMAFIAHAQFRRPPPRRPLPRQTTAAPLLTNASGTPNVVEIDPIPELLPPTSETSIVNGDDNVSNLIKITDPITARPFVTQPRRPPLRPFPNRPTQYWTSPITVQTHTEPNRKSDEENQEQKATNIETVPQALSLRPLPTRPTQRRPYRPIPLRPRPVPIPINSNLQSNLQTSAEFNPKTTNAPAFPLVDADVTSEKSSLGITEKYDLDPTSPNPEPDPIPSKHPSEGLKEDPSKLKPEFDPELTSHDAIYIPTLPPTQEYFPESTSPNPESGSILSANTLESPEEEPNVLEPEIDPVIPTDYPYIPISPSTEKKNPEPSLPNAESEPKPESKSKFEPKPLPGSVPELEPQPNPEPTPSTNQPLKNILNGTSALPNTAPSYPIWFGSVTSRPILKPESDPEPGVTTFRPLPTFPDIPHLFPTPRPVPTRNPIPTLRPVPTRGPLYNPTPAVTVPNFPPTPNYGRPDLNTVPPFQPSEVTPVATVIVPTRQPFLTPRPVSTRPPFSTPRPVFTRPPFRTPRPVPTRSPLYDPTPEIPVSNFLTTPNDSSPNPNKLPPFQPTKSTPVATVPNYPLTPSYGTPEPDTVSPFQPTESTPVTALPSFPPLPSYGTPEPDTVSPFQPTGSTPVTTLPSFPPLPSYGTSEPDTLPPSQPTESTPVPTVPNFPPTTIYGTPKPDTVPTSSFSPTPAVTSRPVMNYMCEEEYAYYPVDNECDSYIECQEYVSRKFLCPDGLLFDPKTHWPSYPCVYPLQVECGNKTVKQNPAPTGECPRRNGIFSSNTGDCGQYMVCDDDRAIYMNCPIGLAFNPELSGCDWPENVPICNLTVFQGFTCPAAPLGQYGRLSEQVLNYRYKDNCKEYIACLRGKPRLLRCDIGLSFDENTGRCIDTNAVINCGGFTTRTVN